MHSTILVALLALATTTFAAPQSGSTPIPLGSQCNPSSDTCASGSTCYAVTSAQITVCGNQGAPCSDDTQCAFNSCLNGACNGAPVVQPISPNGGSAATSTVPAESPATGSATTQGSGGGATVTVTSSSTSTSYANGAVVPSSTVSASSTTSYANGAVVPSGSGSATSSTVTSTRTSTVTVCACTVSPTSKTASVATLTKASPSGSATATTTKPAVYTGAAAMKVAGQAGMVVAGAVAALIL